MRTIDDVLRRLRGVSGNAGCAAETRTGAASVRCRAALCQTVLDSLVNEQRQRPLAIEPSRLPAPIGDALLTGVVADLPRQLHA
jgi:hypothetical protein